MKKKMFSLMLLVGLLVSGTMTAYATETDVVEADTGKYHVTFTQAGKVDDNLGADDVWNAEMRNAEPGDTITASVDVINNNSTTTDWYMKNTILQSMEESKEASGGAYTYKLVYVDPTGAETVLFDNDKVGGDTEGLMNLRGDGWLSDYFYLGALANGQSGKVVLTVGLEGETQGNSYMGKLANLSMNFAVEPQPGTPAGTTTYRTVRREVVNNEVVYLDEDGVPLARNTDIVKTSDEMRLFPYILTACISGSMLLIFALFMIAGRKKEEEEGGAVG